MRRGPRADMLMRVYLSAFTVVKIIRLGKPISEEVI